MPMAKWVKLNYEQLCFRLVRFGGCYIKLGAVMAPTYILCKGMYTIKLVPFSSSEFTSINPLCD
jgi:hypothetical protein